jgi:Ras-related protein Rab-6A
MIKGIGGLCEYTSRLTHSRQVTPEDLDKRAKELGIMSIETSAKAGHNVKSLFKKIAMALPGGNSDAKDASANQSMSLGSSHKRDCELI